MWQCPAISGDATLSRESNSCGGTRSSNWSGVGPVTERFSAAKPSVTPEPTTTASEPLQPRRAGCGIAGLCASLAVQVDRSALVSLHFFIESAGDSVQPLDDPGSLRREVASLSPVGVKIVQ